MSLTEEMPQKRKRPKPFRVAERFVEQPSPVLLHSTLRPVTNHVNGSSVPRGGTAGLAHFNVLTSNEQGRLTMARGRFEDDDLPTLPSGTGILRDGVDVIILLPRRVLSVMAWLQHLQWILVH